MISFLISITVLIGGYFTYCKYVEGVFGVDESRPTPAKTMADGVDYIEMSLPKIFLIQFLNIAGLGPIYGAVSGALFGPVAFLWIVFGNLIAGCTHDYFAGMLSIRHEGKSISEIAGEYLGEKIRIFMRFFSVILLVLIGAVFMTGPAKLLAGLNLGGLGDMNFWVTIIIAYYFIATILPVDKLIGRFYPLFGLALIIMAVSVGGALIFGDFDIPEITLQNMHPRELPVWPMLFITIACGAISGFHSTQSPMMARCMPNEKYGRRIFMGSMVAEGVIALIWAAAAMSFFNGIGGLNEVIASGGALSVVTEVTSGLLGVVGAILAMLGVVAAPITSGDTAFRSSRLIIADALGLKQESVKNRLIIAVPLFVIAVGLTKINFGVVWRYSSWANQGLATVVLWTAAAYLMQYAKNHWVATVPATFMTAVISTYLFVAPEVLGMPSAIGNLLGFALAIVISGMMIRKYKSKENKAVERTA